MPNPEYKEGSLPRRKVPGADLIEQDSSTLVEGLGIHNVTPPTLADGDVSITQLDDMGNIKISLGDPAQVALLGSGAAGTQYNEGDIDATINGTAMMAESAGNVLNPLQLNASKELKVELSSSLVSIGGGTQYDEGDTSATINGTAMMWEDAADTLRSVSAAKPLPVDIKNTSIAVTGTVSLNEPISVEGTLNVTATNLDIRDLVFASDKVDVSGSTGVGVTGTFFQATQPVSAASLPLPSGAATSALQTQPGVDIGDVTINNASGASAVNIQDGGNAITVDGTVGVSGTVAVTQSGTWDEVGINDSGNSITVDNAQLSVVGGGVEATAMRITIANDSTGVVSVDDNGGTLTVDGTVTVTATNLDIRDIDAATDDITVHGDVGILDQLDLTNSNPAVVAIVDANGDQITSFGGGTQYTEGDADATITGTATMMEVAANTLQPIQGTVADGLLVNLGANNDITGTVTANLSATDNAVLDDIAADTESIKTAIEIIDNAISGSEMQVDVLTMPTVTVTATNLDVQSGGADLATTTQAAAIQTAVELIDDAIATLGTTTYTEATTKGLTIGAVRRDADTTLVNTTNEISPLQVDANGRLKVEAFSGETLPVSLTSTTVTGTVAVTQSGTWDEVGINDSGNSITVDYATTGSGTATGALRVELPTNGTGVIATVGAVTAITNALPAGTNAIGKLAANSGVDIGDVDVTSAIITSGTITTVSTVTAVTSITNTVATKEVRSATPSQTSVADNAASVTILASNANRLGTTVANDSSAVLYLLLGSGTASATNYSVRMAQYGYYEVPFGFTGQLTGIWASDPNDGAARVTELTA